jgi:P-type E1-E2 ATPase
MHHAEATLRDGSSKPAAELVCGDLVVVDAGQQIPSDGIVIDGIVLVDESAVTGESAVPVAIFRPTIG